MAGVGSVRLPVGGGRGRHGCVACLEPPDGPWKQSGRDYWVWLPALVCPPFRGSSGNALTLC